MTHTPNPASALKANPPGVAFDLLEQFAPQAANFILEENQELAKLDNFAQSLHLDTVNLYKLNMAVDMAGGDSQEVVNLYKKIEKLHDGDPKNKEKLKKIHTYTGIENIITPKGFVRNDFLTKLDKSIKFHGLSPERKNKLYEILGIPFGGGLDTIFAKGAGALTKEVEGINLTSLAPNAVQIQNAHKVATLASNLKYSAKSTARETENLTKNATKEVVKDITLGSGVPSVTVPSKAIDREDLKMIYRAGKAISKKVTLGGGVPSVTVPSDPIGKEDLDLFYQMIMAISERINLGGPSYTNVPSPMSLFSTRNKEIAPPAKLQTLKKEIDREAQRNLHNRFTQADHFQMLNQKTRDGRGPLGPTQIKFGDIIINNPETDDPFDFAERVTDVITHELQQLSASCSPFF